MLVDDTGPFQVLAALGQAQVCDGGLLYLHLLGPLVEGRAVG